MKYAKNPDMFSISKTYILLCGRTKLIARSTDSPLMFNIEKVKGKNEKGEEEMEKIGEVFTPDPLAICDVLGLPPLKAFAIITTVCEKRRDEAVCKTFETIQSGKGYATRPSSISFADNEKKYNATYSDKKKIRITVTDYTKNGAINVLDVAMEESPKVLRDLGAMLDAEVKDFAKAFRSIANFIDETLDIKKTKESKKEMEMS